MDDHGDGNRPDCRPARRRLCRTQHGLAHAIHHRVGTDTDLPGHILCRGQGAPPGRSGRGGGVPGGAGAAVPDDRFAFATTCGCSRSARICSFSSRASSARSPGARFPLFIVKFLNENKSLSIEAATTAFLLFGVGQRGGHHPRRARRRTAAAPQTRNASAVLCDHHVARRGNHAVHVPGPAAGKHPVDAHSRLPRRVLCLHDRPEHADHAPGHQRAGESRRHLLDLQPHRLRGNRHRQVRGGLLPSDFRRADRGDFELRRVLDSLRDSPVDRRDSSSPATSPRCTAA